MNIETLTAAFTAEMTARLAVASADKGSAAHREALAHWTACEDELNLRKNEARKVFGWRAARTIIGDACMEAEHAVRAAAGTMPAQATYTLVSDPTSPEQCGMAFTPQLSGLVRVEQWEQTDGGPESGPSCCTRLHLLEAAQARDWWREARAEGWQRVA
jgi:hypothetical protein